MLDTFLSHLGERFLHIFLFKGGYGAPFVLGVFQHCFDWLSVVPDVKGQQIGKVL